MASKTKNKDAAAKSAAKVKEHGDDPVQTFRLFDRYKETIVPELMKQFSYKSVMQVPQLEKIAINMGLGDAIGDAKILEQAAEALEIICGQKPVITKATKSISNFKLREGMQIGLRVTLRRGRMYEFLDRFISAAIPRIRDFRGVSDKSFDGRGNYTIGVKEQIIFPEIDVDKIARIFGMDVTFVTSAKTDEEARALLEQFGLPFRKKEVAQA
ncbi:MAG: 50S ribosomal protein L5 [Bacteroidota bacterium]|jgi:large subunit ribosomal protein L5|nr:50S ribosomal protein L5 [Bacteroidota bacterium]